IAFAGRASVLCPLTPDFGFLRLVLDNLDVGSVARGGTRLEEPIRKATAGFGTAGDLSRVILLFTDGEDHDSFPLDAAREAAERGIRIIVIGFGDENGSEIFVTDPRTGARTRVVDSAGRPVISRLDGDLLREIALETEGAYIPAGTGVLDLESIFQAHIRPLMRALGEERGRTVQKDGFQWALLVALLALLGSALVQGRERRNRAALLLAGLALFSAGESRAQLEASLPPPAEDTVIHADEPGDEAVRERIRVPEEPREAYNSGVAALSAGEPDEAERMMESARQNAAHDGELRYRATFNLGWVEIDRAETSIEDAPEAALAHLERAADWLREAIALRPTDPAPRRNLEIVLRRALMLSDALAGREGPDLAARLDLLIEEQRASAEAIRGLVEVVARQPAAYLDEKSKALFKGAALAERQTLDGTTALTRAAGDELESLRNTPEEEISPEQRMREFQLESLLGHVHPARERIGQARSQLRRKQALRAHRRAASGLSLLKRAREQLQDPVRILDGLIGETTRLAGETRQLSAASTGLGFGADRGTTRAPAWLDSEYLGDSQDELARRSSELDAKILAGLDQPPGEQPPEQTALLEILRAAQPPIAEATEALVAGGLSLREHQWVDAMASQARALGALARAREQFLDLKGLIEVSHADETRIGQVLEGFQAEPEADLAEFGPVLADMQARNLERAERMGVMLEEMRFQLDAAPAEDAAGGETGAPDAERERLELADGILALSESTMRAALDSLARIREEGAAAAAQEQVATAIRGLDGLRRLFFTLIEHLRDAGRQQLELADETELVPGLDGDERGPGPQRLAAHQEALAQDTESLAMALHEQSLADPGQLAGSQGAADPADAQAAAEKWVRASEFVLAAADDMFAASTGIHPAAEGDEADSPAREYPLDRVGIRQLQDAALQNILEALAALEPPGEEQQEGDEEQGDSQQQQDQAQPGQGEPEPQDGEASPDPGQLLQAVRDREAERHRRRNERNQSGYEPVDKDW
nr:VWA domain-containing protein [Myxococcota bacterium]